MRHIAMTLQYDGGRYDGWQKQGNTERTLQHTIEKALQQVSGEPSVTIDGAGRTDAGVHALGQVASFSLQADIPPYDVMRQLNRVLPKDICVSSIREVPAAFHARLSATGKVYEYRIWPHSLRNVLALRYAWHVSEPLDIGRMRRAAAQLVGTHDFAAFTAYKGKKSTVRRIEDIRIEERDGFWVLRFSGNGFLYKMIRILVGTLVDASRGAPVDIEGLLAGKKRMEAGVTAPAYGLYLISVGYEAGETANLTQ